ncbi:MAG: BCD family MFS transporter [Hyphomicrobiaceae bacterium]|jgi:BCD family chlorophyll transporter-like MFS transporter
MTPQPLGWFGIVRLGLVQTALGSIVVLTTSTLNRVMVIELALPAMLPGLLVGLHYATQILRPRWGYGSDLGGRRTGWIIGGMITLALGGFAAAVATALMSQLFAFALVLAVLAFLLIGVGVGAAGTTLLVLLAKRVDPSKRAAAATIVWVMMIVGFIVTTAVAGHFLDPFSPSRLVAVSATVSAIAVLLALLAVWNVEGPVGPNKPVSPGLLAEADSGFRKAFSQIWAEPQSRAFAIFVFVSMLAYSSQDLILEPFAGAVFEMTPGQSTKLSSVQHGGVLLGMILVALAASVIGGPRLGSLRGWTIAGCIASAAALALLAIASAVGPAWPLRTTVFALGVANGAYAVAAIGSMMGLAAVGRASREGVRMGLWGAAQAVAFGLGGFLGTVAIDAARYWLGAPMMAYTVVFVAEAALFLVSAVLAARVGRDDRRPARQGAAALTADPI